MLPNCRSTKRSLSKDKFLKYYKPTQANIKRTFKEMCNIDNLCNAFHNEVITACWSYYALKKINASASTGKEVRLTLKRNPIFWNTILYSLQVTLFTTIGRILDKDRRSFSIYTLIDTCIENIDQFSKEKLRKRKLKMLNKDCSLWIDEIVEKTYQPSKEDFESLKKVLEKNNNERYRKYKNIRNKLFGHKDLEIIRNPNELFAGVKILEMEDTLFILYQIDRIIWELYHNGSFNKVGSFKYCEEEHISKNIDQIFNKLK